MKILTFDLEIRKEFAECKTASGGLDFAAMGISFGAAYLSWMREFRVYGEENLGDLVRDMQEAEVVAGFNILAFDLPLLGATLSRLGEELPGFLSAQEKDFTLGGRAYDLFADIKGSLNNPFPKGWKLDNVAKSNLPFTKNGDGADAPGLWKRQELGRLATYVIQDVKVEHALVNIARSNFHLANAFTPNGSPRGVDLVEARRRFQDVEVAA